MHANGGFLDFCVDKNNHASWHTNSYCSTSEPTLNHSTIVPPKLTRPIFIRPPPAYTFAVHGYTMQFWFIGIYLYID